MINHEWRKQSLLRLLTKARYAGVPVDSFCPLDLVNLRPPQPSFGGAFALGLLTWRCLPLWVRLPLDHPCNTLTISWIFGYLRLFLYHPIQHWLVKMHFPAFFNSLLFSKNLQSLFLDSGDPSFPSTPSCRWLSLINPVWIHPPPNSYMQVSRLKILEYFFPIIARHLKSNSCIELDLFCSPST